MHVFCIRSFGNASPTSRSRYHLAPVPGHRSPGPLQNICHSRFLSNRTSRTNRFYHPPVISESEYEFTRSQVARTASKGIRQALREGNVRNAYYAVDAMLHSSLDPKIKPSFASPILAPVMQLGRCLPSRLAAHALVHGLFREGLVLEAGWALQKMMSIGIRFHIRTVEASVSLLCSNYTRSPQEENHVEEHTIDPSPSWGDSDAGISLTSQSGRLRPETRLALNILDTARKSQRQRTESMHGRLIDACLVQGEIVVATLLFVILVKDWQLRKTVRPPLYKRMDINTNNLIPPRRTQEHLLEPTTQMHVRRLGFDKGTPWIPYPAPNILQNILNSINHHILSRNSHDIVRIRSIESLSILANLLQDRILPFGHISPLLRTLQNCPSSPQCYVGVMWNGEYVDINVYDYVHEVLHEYCIRPSAPGPDSPENPSLDLRAYNCLLHYALRHRLSPALADSVLQHMTVHREPPLQPDVFTYNTILRSSSLLRRHDIANEVLEKFRERIENSNHVVSKVVPNVSRLRLRELKRDWHEELQPLSKRIQAEEMTVPNIIVEAPKQQLLHADLCTLSTYITHLVTIGQAKLVAKMVFELIPELHVIDHPASNLPRGLEWTAEQRRERRQACIARAMEYGPYVFSALLNALRKAGKTGLAERVWLLARQAEQASWIPRVLPSPAPWCLPIHAYTSMMQCYANESKKGLACIRGTRFKSNVSDALYPMGSSSRWVPARRGNAIFTRGWAYYFLAMQAKAQGFRNPKPALRIEVSRAVGRLLLSAMRSGAMSVWRELMLLQEDRVRGFPPHWAARLNTLELPVPDARFFNVLLDMFGRRPNMQARKKRTRLAWWNRRLRSAQNRFAATGWLPLTYDPALVEIARVMAQAGFSLPIGLQRALVGRVTFRVQSVTRKLEVRPWGFPPRKKPNLQPFSLHVTKTRGLPLGRRRLKFNGPYRRRKIGARHA